VTVGGKACGPSPSGGVQGKNDYTSWFAGSGGDLEGTYGGYDGMGPPWNDERIHAYRFQVFALDVDSVGLDGAFSGAELQAAMSGHVLARAELICLYTINLDARERP
jgi:phosphatidylethanolamine-binding protein (PEBP) family uncharacterized protein